jgi:hypothetical protein
MTNAMMVQNIPKITAKMLPAAPMAEGPRPGFILFKGFTTFTAYHYHKKIMAGCHASIWMLMTMLSRKVWIAETIPVKQ